MEYQKKKNLLDNAPDRPSKFRIENWVKIDNESKESYSTGHDIKFKTIMLRPSLCDYADACILVKRKITISWEGDNDAEKRLDEINKGVIFKNYSSFTKWITRIYGTGIDNAEDIDIVMPERE